MLKLQVKAKQDKNIIIKLIFFTEKYLKNEAFLHDYENTSRKSIIHYLVK